MSDAFKFKNISVQCITISVVNSSKDFDYMSHLNKSPSET